MSKNKQTTLEAQKALQFCSAALNAPAYILNPNSKLELLPLVLPGYLVTQRLAHSPLLETMSPTLYELRVVTHSRSVLAL